MPWLTPPASPSILAACRRLSIPEDYMPAVHGALLALTVEANWEEHGVDTPSEAAGKMQDMLDDWEGGCMPVGMIVPAVTASVPDGYLVCDGTEYDEVDYPELYDAIDAFYHTGPDTFKVPDFRGRLCVGYSSGGPLSDRDIGDTGGTETHTLSLAEMPAHTHTIHTHFTGLDVESAGVPDLSSSPPLPSELTSSAGGDGAHQNMPPFGVAYWLIKALP